MKHKRLLAAFLALLMLFAAALSVAAAGIDGSVELSSGNHTRWIDRLDLTHADAAPLLDLYEALEEAADNDGVDDFLIDDHTENYRYQIVTLTGTFVAADAAAAEIEAGEVGTEIMERYKPFVMAVYDAFDRDHPEVFWLSGERRVSYGMRYQLTSGTTYEYTLELSFVVKSESFDIRSAVYPTAASIKTAILQRDERVQQILAGVSTQNTYGILRYFNEKLTKTNEYSTNLSLAPKDSWECISALAGRTGTSGPVCEGYARALKVLCDKMSIPCVLVDGNAKSTAAAEGEAHMWNYVQVDGAWYALDVTWNDPVGGASGAVSGVESEKWFLLGSETTVGTGLTFIASHPVTNRASQEGVLFENGPTLSVTACADPSAVPETVLSGITVTDGEGQTGVTYGETLRVTVTAKAGETNADTQKMELYCGDEKLSESSDAEGGVYILTYDTMARKLPAGRVQALSLRFAGDGVHMASATAAVNITLGKATPTVAFAADSQTVDHTGSAVQITAPAITLLGTDTPDGALTYSYVKTQNTDVSGNGLPSEAGTYTVTATLSEDDWYLSASDTVTLTVSPTSAFDGIGTGGEDQSNGNDTESGSVGSGLSGLLNDSKNAVTEAIKYSSLRTVLIVFAVVGVLCMLIAILFGRKKKE